MIIGYARVSTTEQNLDLQLKALQEAGCETIFSDKASGSSMSRPEWEKCNRSLKDGDTLVIWKLDRLSRSMLDLINTVQKIGERGIGFKVITAPIDTTTIQGRLVFGIFAALAEFERGLIRERVNAGIKAAKARGVRFGNPQKVTPELLERARLLLEDDAEVAGSVRRAAQKLGVSKSALYQYL